ncbi:MAG: hypothetical protein ACR2MS_01835 [Weeksellaceae bacterium]
MKFISLFFILCVSTKLFSQEVLLEENFSHGIPTNWSVESTMSSRNWYAKTYKETTYVTMSAFAGKGKQGYEVMAKLHTPLLEIGQKQCKLRFTFADAYGNGQPLQVFLTDEQFNIVKKLDEKAWAHLVNNSGKYDNKYEAVEWIALPRLNKAYRISFVYDSKQEDKIITTIIQLKEVDVWCE